MFVLNNLSFDLWTMCKRWTRVKEKMFLCSYCGSKITEVSMKFMTETPRWNFQDKFVCDLYRFTVTPTLYEVPIFCVVFFSVKEKHSSYENCKATCSKRTGHIFVTLIWKKILLLCRLTAGARVFCSLVLHSSDKHMWDIYQCPSAS
jgi:hypothetical protein